MNHTDAQINALMDRHDGSNGWAGTTCPSCHVIHPCSTWLLAQDVLTARRAAERAAEMVDAPTAIRTTDHVGA